MNNEQGLTKNDLGSKHLFVNQKSLPVRHAGLIIIRKRIFVGISMKNYLLTILVALCFYNAAAQVPNPGFEQWTNLLPDYWTTNSCPFCDPPWESYIVRQDSDAYSGNYNADLYANGVFKPFAYTIFPVSARPRMLRFYAKVDFPPCINDSGFPADTVMAKVELLNNSIAFISGSWQYTGQSISNYQLIEIYLPTSATPFDSCRIRFEGGAVFGGCGIIPLATQFRVDEVEIIYDSTGCYADFYFSKRIDTVNLYGSSGLPNVNGWLWNFGDSQTSNQQNPQHIYQQDRWYTVCLTAAGQDSSGINFTVTFCDSVFVTHDCIDSSLICPPPSLCCDAPLYEPVCGCDSVTYDNACQAALWYGVTKYTEGPCITGVSEVENAISVSINPNPAKEIVMLTYKLNEHGLLTVQVKNVLGESAGELNNVFVTEPSFSHSVNLEILMSGLYFVEIRMNGKIIAMKKLVKE